MLVPVSSSDGAGTLLLFRQSGSNGWNLHRKQK